MSRSAIAFAALIEEVAYLLDPTAVVRIEIVSGTEGSFGLNTLTKIVSSATATLIGSIKAGAAKHPRIKWLTLYVAFRIMNNAVDWSQDQVMDWMKGPDAPAVVQKMTDQDKRDIAADILQLMRQEAGKPQVQTLYRELERDTKIEGVGVSSVPGKRPTFIVSRDQFRAGDVVASPDSETRVSLHDLEVTLISPVLLAGERRWKFRSSTGEFGAPNARQGLHGRPTIRQP